MSTVANGGSTGDIRARMAIWGARGTCPSPGAHTARYGGNTSCVDVLLANGARVVLDAGTGLRVMGNSLTGNSLTGTSLTGNSLTRGSPSIDSRGTSTPHAVDALTTITIVLTHRHSDHVIGLAHFAPLITGRHRVRIACGGVDGEVLRALVQQQLSAPLFPNVDGVLEQVEVVGLEFGASLSVGDDCVVHAIAGNHPGGASVLRVDDAHGPLLAYAPDNELLFAHDGGANEAHVASWRRALAASLRGVPVLMHDATYTDDEIARHVGWGHSSAESATRFAMECDAQHLFLTHHHPDRSDDAIDAMVDTCRAIAADAGSPLRVSAAAEGQIIDV